MQQLAVIHISGAAPSPLSVYRSTAGLKLNELFILCGICTLFANRVKIVNTNYKKNVLVLVQGLRIQFSSATIVPRYVRALGFVGELEFLNLIRLDQPHIDSPIAPPAFTNEVLYHVQPLSIVFPDLPSSSQHTRTSANTLSRSCTSSIQRQAEQQAGYVQASHCRCVSSESSRRIDQQRSKPYSKAFF